MYAMVCPPGLGDAEQPRVLEGGDPPRVLQGEPLQLRDPLRRQPDEGRRCVCRGAGRRQVGAIRLDQQVLDLHPAHHLPKRLVGRVGDRAGDGDINPHVDALPRHLQVPREAVQKPRRLPWRPPPRGWR